MIGVARWVFLLAVLLGPLTVAATRPAAAGHGYAPLAAAGRWNIDPIGHIGGFGGTPRAFRAPYAYVAFGPELAVVDFSDPNQPVRIGSVLLAEAIGEIDLAGNYLYVRHGFSSGRLSIVDISNPGFPHLVSTVVDIIPFYSWDLVVSENYAYIPWGSCDRIRGCFGGVRVIDLSNPLAPTVAGAYDAGTPVFAIFLQGRRAHVVVTAEVAGAGSEIRIIDFANPAAPQRLGTYGAPGGVSDLIISGAYAYIGVHNCLSSCDASGLAIADISNPAAPRLTGWYAAPDSVNDLVIVGHYAYLAMATCYVLCDTGGLAVVDISNPARPVGRGTFAGPGGAYSVAVAGEHAYLTSTYGCSTICRGYLTVLTVAKPAAPRLIGQVAADPFGRIVGLVGAYAYIGGETGVQAVDIARPAAPRAAPLYWEPGTVEHIRVQGNYVYTLGSSGLSVLDRANSTNPRAIGSYTMPNEAVDMDIAGGYAYITWISRCEPECHTGLKIVDLANPLAPREVAGLEPAAGARNVTVAGRYAYVSNGCSSDCPSTITVVDVSQPARPKAAGVYNFAHSILDVAVRGVYAYVATLGGLRIVDFSDPAAPREAGIFAASEDFYAVTLSGQYAYVQGETDLQIVDISDPVAPRLLGRYAPIGRYPPGAIVRVVEPYAYIASDYQLQVIDISNPAAPRQVGRYTNRSNFTVVPNVDLDVADGVIYLAQDWDGLFVLRFAGASSLTGRVRDWYGRPFPGVTIASSDGRQATTDATGVYTFTDVFSATYTLTPTLAGFAFDPPVRMLAVPPNAEPQDFMILPGPVTATLTPEASASLIYTDTQGLPTRLDLPAGLVTQTTKLVLTPTLALDGGGFAFAGHAFELAAIQDGSQLTDFTFGVPVTATIQYSGADVRVVRDLQRLALRSWDGAGWVDPAEPCGAPRLDSVSKTIDVPICRTGRYSLFGPTNQLSLPLIGRAADS